MKKIVLVILCILGFSLTAQAQEKEKSIPQLAKEQAEALGKYLNLSTELTADFQTLMEIKLQQLATPDLSKERKEYLFKNTEAKIKAGLSPEQVAKLDQNPALLNQLTH